MKFDMHCHTREGSIDGKISLERYISCLREKGFGGMVITDHNSYDGYRHWKERIKGKLYRDFVVLKGIEYDTLDAGHILVIMPEQVKLRILELRGLPVRLLIEIVHRFGGILGPAHPCGEKYLSFTKSHRFKKDPSILKLFDFVEGFNACEYCSSNTQAISMARELGLPAFGGSDSHKECSVGMAYTEVPDGIKKESELIQCVKESRIMDCGGELYQGTARDKLGRANDLLLYSFWVYNKTAALYRSISRHHELRTKIVL